MAAAETRNFPTAAVLLSQVNRLNLAVLERAANASDTVLDKAVATFESGLTQEVGNKDKTHRCTPCRTRNPFPGFFDEKGLSPVFSHV